MKYFYTPIILFLLSCLGIQANDFHHPFANISGQGIEKCSGRSARNIYSDSEFESVKIHGFFPGKNSQTLSSPIANLREAHEWIATAPEHRLHWKNRLLHLIRKIYQQEDTKQFELASNILYKNLQQLCPQYQSVLDLIEKTVNGFASIDVFRDQSENAYIDFLDGNFTARYFLDSNLLIYAQTSEKESLPSKALVQTSNGLQILSDRAIFKFPIHNTEIALEINNKIQDILGAFIGLQDETFQENLALYNSLVAKLHTTKIKKEEEIFRVVSCLTKIYSDLGEFFHELSQLDHSLKYQKNADSYSIEITFDQPKSEGVRSFLNKRMNWHHTYTRGHESQIDFSDFHNDILLTPEEQKLSKEEQQELIAKRESVAAAAKQKLFQVPLNGEKMSVEAKEYLEKEVILSKIFSGTPFHNRFLAIKDFFRSLQQLSESGLEYSIQTEYLESGLTLTWPWGFYSLHLKFDHEYPDRNISIPHIHSPELYFLDLYLISFRGISCLSPDKCVHPMQLNPNVVVERQDGGFSTLTNFSCGHQINKENLSSFLNSYRKQSLVNVDVLRNPSRYAYGYGRFAIKCPTCVENRQEPCGLSPFNSIYILSDVKKREIAKTDVAELMSNKH